MNLSDIISLILRIIVLPLIIWAARRVYRKLRRVRPDVDPHIESLVSHTATLISKRVWHFNLETDDFNSTFVALSAEIKGRIPTTLEKRAPNLRGSGPIRNLNLYLRNKKTANIPIAITGSPGSGKTFEIVKLYLDLWTAYRNQKDWLPILIFANELSARPFESLNDKHPLRDFIVNYLRSTSHPINVVEFIESRFYQLRLVLLFDALDEIPDKHDYQTAIQSITHRLLPSVNDQKWRFILTCRTEDYDPTLGLLELEIQPLTYDQINRFFQKKASRSHDVRWKHDTWRRLRNADMRWFEPFIDNPYFLSLMLDSLEDSLNQGSTSPLDLRSLFSRTLARELEKPVRKQSPNKDTTVPSASFETACSILGTILLEKTLHKEEAVWSPWNKEDVGRLLYHCEHLLDKVSPFSLINSLVHGDRAARRRAELDLSSALSPDIAHMTIQLVDSLRSARSGFEGTLTESETIALNSALSLCSGRAIIPVDLIASAIVTMRLFQEGINRRLLRERPEPLQEITGFRHRRLLEYFAATYLENTRTMLGEKVDNLWYKQTLLILGGIQTDPRWLLSAIGRQDSTRLILAAEILRFVHPTVVLQASDHLSAVVRDLASQAFSSSSSSAGLQALDALARLLSAHPNAASVVSPSHIANAAGSVTFYRSCLRLLQILEKQKHLKLSHYYKFGIRGFRNIVTISSN